jgi:SAM-dependent methyltransferase
MKFEERSMKPEYDEKIISHYNKIAEKCGLSSQSTMEDEIVRKKETMIIRDFVANIANESRSDLTQNGKDLIILDAGCGNGYTLKCLAGDLTSYSYIGVEYNDKLRDLALQQVTGMANVRVLSGDLRKRETINIKNESVDILLCQRVLINLLSDHDTKIALNNIVSLVKPNGRLLFIESFTSGLANLNNARMEFGLEPISPAYHNKYLDDDFFSHPDLQPCPMPYFNIPRNILSTHYYVSRVLHAALLQQLQQSDWKRNTHFVKFLSAALPDGVGDYAPLQFHFFSKKGH